jgi:alkylation response protein AidB-like acyl-CoA dehydrogenase
MQNQARKTQRSGRRWDSPATKLDAARAELTALAAAHREGDALRHLPPALAQAFLAHDVYRMLLPSDLGGAAVDPLDYMQLIEDIARVDGAIGWNLAIGIGSGLYAGYLPPERTRPMFADPHCGIAGAYAPMGRGERVEGGYRVSGHWGWASGAHEARWMVIGFTADEDGNKVARQALAPREAFRILDTWYVSGMRGTGSTEYEVENLFVAADMTFQMFIGKPRHPAPLFRLPGAFFGAVIATVAIGIAQGTVEALAHLAEAKRSPSGHPSLRDQAYAQYCIAKAEALAESSALYLRESIAEIWRTIGRGGGITLEQRMRARRASVQAAEASVEAVDLCCRAAGGSALFQSLPFERAQRDVHATMGHFVLQRAAMEDAGRARFGLDPLSPVF